MFVCAILQGRIRRRKQPLLNRLAAVVGGDLLLPALRQAAPKRIVLDQLLDPLSKLSGVVGHEQVLVRNHIEALGTDSGRDDGSPHHQRLKHLALRSGAVAERHDRDASPFDVGHQRGVQPMRCVCSSRRATGGASSSSPAPTIEMGCRSRSERSSRGAMSVQKYSRASTFGRCRKLPTKTIPVRSRRGIEEAARSSASGTQNASPGSPTRPARSSASSGKPRAHHPRLRRRSARQPSRCRSPDRVGARSPVHARRRCVALRGRNGGRPSRRSRRSQAKPRARGANRARQPASTRRWPGRIGRARERPLDDQPCRRRQGSRAEEGPPHTCRPRRDSLTGS